MEQNLTQKILRDHACNLKLFIATKQSATARMYMCVLQLHHTEYNNHYIMSKLMKKLNNNITKEKRERKKNTKNNKYVLEARM